MSVGLVLGGVLAPIDWRMVFLISVPVGLFGTVWAYLKLKDVRPVEPRRRDEQSPARRPRGRRW
jgi:MFS family permease